VKPRERSTRPPYKIGQSLRARPRFPLGGRAEDRCAHGRCRLLTAGDVAALLGVPESWVYARSREGRLPTVRLGRYYRYRRAAIAAWLAEQER